MTPDVSACAAVAETETVSAAMHETAAPLFVTKTINSFEIFNLLALLCPHLWRRGRHTPREAEPQREEVAEGDAEAGHEAGARRLACHH